MDVRDVDILALIGADTVLKRVGGTRGGEYAGPCPFCGGTDRFRVWPADTSTTDHRGKWWCRQCLKSGDAIEYLRERDGLSYGEACQQLGVSGKASRQGATRSTDGKSKIAVPPPAGWQACGMRFVEFCEQALWDEKGRHALDWLHGRGFNDSTLRASRIGWNGTQRFGDPARWDLPAGKKIWAPVGVVIPWIDSGTLWRVQFRRLDLMRATVNGVERVQMGPDPEPKYVHIRGSGDALYGADALDGSQPVMLTEGVFTSLAIQQEAGDIVTAVAAGSTKGGHGTQWIARLSLAPLVLIAFDADKPGDEAAERWQEKLPGSRRRRPYWDDANAMLQDCGDVWSWVEAGLVAHEREARSHETVPESVIDRLGLDLRDWEPDVEGAREEYLIEKEAWEKIDPDWRRSKWIRVKARRKDGGNA